MPPGRRLLPRTNFAREAKWVSPSTEWPANAVFQESIKQTMGRGSRTRLPTALIPPMDPNTMAGFSRKAGRPRASRALRLAQLVLLILIAMMAALFTEHWRGERALEAWRSEMKDCGEIFDPNKL